MKKRNTKKGFNPLAKPRKTLTDREKMLKNHMARQQLMKLLWSKQNDPSGVNQD